MPIWRKKGTIMTKELKKLLEVEWEFMLLCSPLRIYEEWTQGKCGRWVSSASAMFVEFSSFGLV